jgi:outer membrane protein assembly factor BamE (lipoprotein component of BamABCDE complex)
MTSDPVRKNHVYFQLACKGNSTEVKSLQRVILQTRFIFSLLVLIIMISSCATPHIQPADTQLLLNSEILGFIQDGITTREEVVLKLGIPSAQFEGEKILTYQLRADQAGKWHLVTPRINAATGLREWREETCSLVLVFDGDGVLRKHSLVEAK